jgi:ELWxxDGT repeat protein
MSQFLSLRTGLALTASLAFASAVAAQTSFNVVKDINTNPSTTLTNSYPYPERPYTSQSYRYKWAQLNGVSYFEATTAATGYELFKSDGKTATLVADIRPGSNSSSISNITVIGTNIFFAANNGVNGTELWMSDGTKAGTKMVKDINTSTATASSSPSYFAAVAGKLVFRANDGKNGTELWVSDGTAAGTVMLMDINTTSATASGSPSYMKSNFVGNLAFFYANDGKTGTELYVTNGTAAGTKLLLDINQSTATASSYPRDYHPLGAIQVVFEANDGVNGLELWVSDGTTAGTKLVADIYTGASGYVDTGVGVSMGKKVIFRARDLTSGYEAFVTDGTKAGTMLLKDAYAGTSNGYLYYAFYNGTKAYYGVNNASGSYTIYETDGTPAGTKLFGPSMISSSSPSYLYEHKGNVYFYARDVTAGTGYEISVTDGTTAKTLQDTWPGTSSGYAYYIDEIAPGIMGFASSDGKAGRELWVYDYTTFKMIDINPPVVGVTANDSVSYIETLFGRLIFEATDGTSTGNFGSELYVSDGTAGGTKLLKDIYPGTSSSSPYYMCRLGNHVYFRANDGVNGTELWRTDGTTAGTVLFMDINTATTTASGYPQYMTRIGDKMYFYANDGTTGNELWISDGTKVGTKLVKDIYVGTSSSSPNNFARLGLTDMVVFSAYDGTATTGTGNELYITDGTAAGTKLLKDIYASGTSGGYPQYCRSMGDKVYFRANNGTNGYELWETDGTTAGTKMVIDNYVGSSSGYADYIAVQDGMLYYRSNNGTTGTELYTSDGTAAGTKVYLDYTAGSGSTSPYIITAVGSRRLYFRGTDQAKGSEVMWTDVTATTPTFNIPDLNPLGNSSPYNYRGGHYEFAVESGNVYCYATLTSSPTDYQLIKMVNGGTAQSIGRATDSSVMTATDPVIGKNITIKGTTSVPNPLSVLCLGVPTPKPAALTGLVPGSYGYFQVGNFFWIIGNLPGKAWANVFPIPNDPTIVGLNATLQSFCLDALKFPTNTEVTNGVQLTMGK